VARDGYKVLLEVGQAAVVEVEGEVLDEVGVGVVGYEDFAGAEDGGDEGGQAGSGAELEDGVVGDEARCVGGVLEVGGYRVGGVPEVVALGGRG